MTIMMPGHRSWDSFCKKLGKAINDSKTGCDARTTRFAKAILKKMPGIDVAGSIAYFEENGGYCDCEILMNVDRR